MIPGLVYFGTLSAPCSGGFSTNIPLQGISSRMYLYWETIGTRCWKATIMFVNTLEIPFQWMSRALVVMPTGLGGFGPTSHRNLLQLQHFLLCLHLLIRRWMTSWIQTGLLCRLFEMIYPPWHWSTKWGTTEGFSHLYDVSTVIRISRLGARYGVGCSHQNPYRIIG